MDFYEKKKSILKKGIFLSAISLVLLVPYVDMTHAGKAEGARKDSLLVQKSPDPDLVELGKMLSFDERLRRDTFILKDASKPA